MLENCVCAWTPRTPALQQVAGTHPNAFTMHCDAVMLVAETVAAPNELATNVWALNPEPMIRSKAPVTLTLVRFLAGSITVTCTLAAWSVTANLFQDVLHASACQGFAGPSSPTAWMQAANARAQVL